MLAIGHSARDTYEMLVRRGVPMVPKPFQFGVRIEQPQEQVNRVQYGPTPRRTNSAPPTTRWSPTARCHDLFTFCMCAGGYVMPERFGGRLLLHQRHEPVEARFAVRQQRPGRDGACRTHSAATDVLAGVRLQQRYEQRAFELGRGEYRCPVQTATRFLGGSRLGQTAAVELPARVVSARPTRSVAAVCSSGRGRRVAADGPPLARSVPGRRGSGRTGSPWQFTGSDCSQFAHA